MQSRVLYYPLVVEAVDTELALVTSTQQQDRTQSLVSCVKVLSIVNTPTTCWTGINIISENIPISPKYILKNVQRGTNTVFKRLNVGEFQETEP